MSYLLVVKLLEAAIDLTYIFVEYLAHCSVHSRCLKPVYLVQWFAPGHEKLCNESGRLTMQYIPICIVLRGGQVKAGTQILGAIQTVSQNESGL